ncbi:MAG: Abi-alpha family protein [Acetobacter okinawensis]
MDVISLGGAVAAFNYADKQMDGALKSYFQHRLETTADYVTNGAWKKIWGKTFEKLKGKKIEQDPNLEFVDEILNRTKLQTDDNLSELWARILANALQGKSHVRMEYFDVLEKLNPYDAIILNIALSDDYISNSGTMRKSARSGILTSAKFENNLSMFLAEKYSIDSRSTSVKLSQQRLSELDLIKKEQVLGLWVLTLLGEGLKECLTVEAVETV